MTSIVKKITQHEIFDLNLIFSKMGVYTNYKLPECQLVDCI